MDSNFFKDAVTFFVILAFVIYHVFLVIVLIGEKQEAKQFFLDRPEVQGFSMGALAQTLIIIIVSAIMCAIWM